jgi:hypothetical protein
MVGPVAVGPVVRQNILAAEVGIGEGCSIHGRGQEVKEAGRGLGPNIISYLVDRILGPNSVTSFH